jgi:hypothetical protein
VRGNPKARVIVILDNALKVSSGARQWLIKMSSVTVAAAQKAASGKRLTLLANLCVSK